MLRVHDPRDPAPRGGHPSQHADFGRVGVNHVGGDPADQSDQLDQEAEIVGQAPPAGGPSELVMLIAGSAQPLAPRARRAGQHHLVPGPAEGIELRAQEELEGRVDGGQLEHAQPPVRVRGCHERAD